MLLPWALQHYRHAQGGPGQANGGLPGVETDVVDDAAQRLARRPLCLTTRRLAFVGGAGQLFGPLVGALILVPLEELSNSYLGGRGAGLTFVVYGAIIVIIARFLPSGLLSLLDRRKVNRAD